MDWILLIAAGLFEVGFATCLKLSENFTRLWPTLAFMASGAASFFLLSLAMRTIPVGTAYAVWTGMGAFGTAVVGIALFKDPANLWRVVFLGTLVLSVIGLRFTSTGGSP